jgi:hypothetical protein
MVLHYMSSITLRKTCLCARPPFGPGLTLKNNVMTESMLPENNLIRENDKHSHMNHTLQIGILEASLQI